jgi:microcystin-dependent protein
MTLVVLPFRPNPGELEDVTQIMLDFDAILAVLNGGITTDNIAPGGLDNPAVLSPALQQSLVPSGSIMPFAADAAPAGYLMCNGAEYDTTSPYDKLFAAIQYKYGGSGAKFNVPNLKGRVPVGSDSSIAEFNALNKPGGEQKHKLVSGEMPIHDHPTTQSFHSHPTSQNPHAHVPYDNVGGGQLVGTKNSFHGPYGEALEHSGEVGAQDLWLNPTTGIGYADLTVGGSTANLTVLNSGNDQAHENMPPYVVVNYIIKT